MNNDINQPQGNQPTGGVGLPPLPSIPEMPSIPAGPTTPPVILADAGIHSNRFPIESGMTEEVEGSISEPEKPKNKINKKLVFGGTLVLLLLGGAIALAAQFGLFRGDLRQRAAGPCSPNGDSHCGSDGVQYVCSGNSWQPSGSCGGGE